MFSEATKCTHNLDLHAQVQHAHAGTEYGSILMYDPVQRARAGTDSCMLRYSMHALVLILSCVVLLAIVQASYSGLATKRASTADGNVTQHVDGEHKSWSHRRHSTEAGNHQQELTW